MKRRLRRLLVASLLLGVGYCLLHFARGYTISFYGFPHFSVRPNESSVERNGLRTTIKSLARVDDDVELSYPLEWVKPRPNERRAHFMRPFVRMHVAFFDGNGDAVFERIGDEGHTTFSCFLMDLVSEEWP